MSKLILFDIDGTLVLTGRAGVRAMTRALVDVFGINDGFADISLAGRTDRYLLGLALEQNQVVLNARELDRFRERYVRYLVEEVPKRGEGRKGVMPGITALLDTLEQRDDVFLGLLTGNFAEAARIKLEYFDLWRYFRCGAYGDDAHDRNDLVPVALARARECGNGGSFDRIFIVGDTPHDIACAAAGNAMSIAVATGGFDVSTLRAAGADVVFQDLSDTQAFVKFLEGKAPFDSAR
ncbi:MAG TPA: HAD family hydrolase [Vicinamibacterales bacterium]|jgi:phosphoglycolate phosphatase-like HAD superfamily hydrolase|nr:HAD family hydrolase [Vicinamibacterales bacterium]